MITLTNEGVGGCFPHAASPSGGERESPSWLPQKISELHKKKRISTKPFLMQMLSIVSFFLIFAPSNADICK
jgi:hypothetical protein